MMQDTLLHYPKYKINPIYKVCQKRNDRKIHVN